MAMAKPQPGSPPSSMSSIEDTELLQRISKHRDEQAFARLFERHSSSALSVAFHITRDQETAEEAVQSAMLTVWNGAHKFKDGNPRSWILRIVANKSLNLVRGQRRRKAKMTSIKKEKALPEISAPGDDLEKRELYGILRGLLDNLKQQDRQFMALYYGGGLTQQEIADATSLSQFTISERLNQALEQLRTRLRKKGYTSPTLAGLPGLLTEALQTGHVVPPALKANVLSLIAEENLKAASVPPSASTSTTTLPMIAAMMLLPLGGLVGWTYVNQTATPARPSIPKLDGSSDPTGRPAVLASYDFTKALPEDLDFIAGTWRWGKGGLRAPATLPGGYFSLSMPTPGIPFQVLAQAQNTGEKSVKITMGWSSKTEMRPPDLKLDTTRLQIHKNETLRYRAEFNGPYVAEYLNNELFQVQRYAQRRPSGFLYMHLQGFSLKRLEIRRLKRNSVAPAPTQWFPRRAFKKANQSLGALDEIPSEPLVFSSGGGHQLLRAKHSRKSIDPFENLDPALSSSRCLHMRWPLVRGQPQAPLAVGPSGPSTNPSEGIGFSFKEISRDGLRQKLELKGIRKRPFVLIAKTMVIKRSTQTATVKSGTVTCRWGTPSQSWPYLIWRFPLGKNFNQMTEAQDTNWVRFYVVDNFIVMVRENSKNGFLLEHQWPYPGDRIYLSTENLWITHLEYQELKREDLPKPLFTLRPFIESERQSPFYNPAVPVGRKLTNERAKSLN